jgi:hypothetical protein
MKKIVILFLIASAFFILSCNKYCNCKHYVNGKVDKKFKSEFIKESKLDCKEFSTEKKEIEGITYETKCK